MNETFIIPNNASLFNIKSIYNKFIDEFSESSMENYVVNPHMDNVEVFAGLKQVSSYDSSTTIDGNEFHLGDGDWFKQDMFKLKANEVYTLLVDFVASADIRVAFETMGNSEFIDFYNKSNLNPPTTILKHEIDEFDTPLRVRQSYTFETGAIVPGDMPKINFISLDDNNILIHNISIVRGTFALNLERNRCIFTDYIRYSNDGVNDNFYEVSYDGINYFRLFTSSDTDIQALLDVLSQNMYTKLQSDEFFLRKDIDDHAEGVITFDEGFLAEKDAVVGENAKLVLEGGSMVVNNRQTTGIPSDYFSLMVRRGDHPSTGIRYNESINRWEYTHDGIEWKIFGTGDGASDNQCELEYFAEILDKTCYGDAYYDLFDEIGQDSTVISVNVDYDTENSTYKTIDPLLDSYVITQNIWRTEDENNSFTFFIHALTDKFNNAGLSVAYTLFESDPAAPPAINSPEWIDVDLNETIQSVVPITQFYLKFKWNEPTVIFHSFAVFYGIWNYSSSPYTRMREFLTIQEVHLPDTDLVLPNNAKYSIGDKALELYVNRVRQILDVDYTEVSSAIVNMHKGLEPGDILEFYEKYGYVDLSGASTTSLSSMNTRIENVEDWQTAFTELDTAALTALTSHIDLTTNAHYASAIFADGTVLDNTSANNVQEVLLDFDAIHTDDKTWNFKNAVYNAKHWEKILADTTDGPFTITLPATPENWEVIRIMDFGGTFSTNNLTIDPNGKPFMGAAGSKVFDTDHSMIFLVFYNNSGGWRFSQ